MIIDVTGTRSAVANRFSEMAVGNKRRETRGFISGLGDEIGKKKPTFPTALPTNERPRVSRSTSNVSTLMMEMGEKGEGERKRRATVDPILSPVYTEFVSSHADTFIFLRDMLVK